MTILALGINHKTASVGLREKVAFVDDKRKLALEQIQTSGLAESVVILSTCNRTELYFHQPNISPVKRARKISNGVNNVSAGLPKFINLMKASCVNVYILNKI